MHKLDKDKRLNSKCICKKGLNWIDKDIVMMDPCEHLLHKDCYNKSISMCECPYCHKPVDKCYTEDELYRLKPDPVFYQKYVDMVSIRNINSLSDHNDQKFLAKVPKVLGVLGKIPFSKGYDEGIKLAKEIMCLVNAKLVVRGEQYIKPGPKVIIANHTIDFDSIPLFYIFKCGFLSSKALLESWLGKQLSKIVPLLIIDRGDHGTNTVQKMTEYVESHGSICLFPEGIMTHPDTIIRFRTGAFHIGYPIYPVVLSYDPVIYDASLNICIKKLLSQDQFTITVNILPPEYPPFDDNKIELIRRKMGRAGNMALSRVSNKDITEE